MISYLSNLNFPASNLFHYITFRAAAAFAVASVGSIVALRFALPLLSRLGERISEDVPARHARKEGTPSSGGAVFVLVCLVTTAVFAKPNALVLTAAFAVLYLGVLGFADDLVKLKSKRRRGLSMLVKLALQLLLAAAVLVAVRRIFGEDYAYTQVLFAKNFYLYLGPLTLLFIALVFVGTTNAVNLTDGLDGLAAGAALPPIGAFMIIAYIAGNAVAARYLNLMPVPGAGELAVLGGAFAGVLLGFLWYNAHPAKVFMGDTGSQAVGGALAVMAILTKHELLLAVAGGVFVIETLSVAAQIAYFKATRGKRVFLRAPLHHHYEEKGEPESRIVVRFWILSIVFSLLALSTLKIR